LIFMRSSLTNVFLLCSPSISPGSIIGRAVMTWCQNHQISAWSIEFFVLFLRNLVNIFWCSLYEFRTNTWSFPLNHHMLINWNWNYNLTSFYHPLIKVTLKVIYFCAFFIFLRERERERNTIKLSSNWTFLQNMYKLFLNYTSRQINSISILFKQSDI
jgi:hypothetical protein